MKSFLLFITLFISTFTFSQSEETSDSGSEFDKIKEKLVFDGNISFQFGTTTTIGINPQIGYQFTDELVAGLGYSYNSQSYTFLGTKYSSSAHGPTLFGRYMINSEIFVRADFQTLKVSSKGSSDFDFPSTRVERFLVGGGYRYEISPKIYATAGAYIDLLNDARLEIRGGVEARF